MGPGGFLYRHHDTLRCSSFNAAASRGVEQLSWPEHWAIGHGQGGAEDRRFKGAALSVQIAQTQR
jgi:hypothetical protein